MLPDEMTRKPPGTTAPGSSDLWRRLRWPILLAAAIFVLGVSGYMLLEGWSFLDALYMTMQILTTVGFGETRELDTGGKIFTIVLIVLGVVAVLVTISLLAGWVSEGGLGEGRRRRRMQARIDRMSDHTIVCAYGRVGRAVAREYEAEAAPFVAIDIDEDLAAQMEQDGVTFLIGDPSREGVLRAAGVDRARGLVCAVDSDATNVYITLLARSLNPNLFIVARSSEPGSAERLYRAGADRVVSPYVTSGRHMAQQALRPRVLDYLEVTTRDERPLRLEELQVTEGSPLVGRGLQEACGSATPLAIRRADGAVIPNPDAALHLQAGDLLILLGEPAALRHAEQG
jgi:voltage-gated potassium channel